jgi:hypothetical protein
MRPRRVREKDHGSKMLTSHGPWRPRVGTSGSPEGKGAWLSSIVLDLLLHARSWGSCHPPSPHHSTSFRYDYCCVRALPFCFAILVRPRVTFLCIA